MIYSNQLGSIFSTIRPLYIEHNNAKIIFSEFNILAKLQLTTCAEDLL
jgi:hypothetical protein